MTQFPNFAITKNHSSVQNTQIYLLQFWRSRSDMSLVGLKSQRWPAWFPVEALGENSILSSSSSRSCSWLFPPLQSQLGSISPL
jgi:hypothetical protein